MPIAKAILAGVVFFAAGDVLNAVETDGLPGPSLG